MKTNLGLVEYVNSKLKLPTIYMLSGFGRVLTAAAVDKRIAKGDQHTIQNEAIIRAGIGDYVYDCCGLIKGYLWEVAPGNVVYKTIDGVYDATSDQGVAGMYNTAPVKGPIAEMPDVPGMLVFTADLGHVGVYVGKKNGINQYVESTPAWKAWGVTTSADKDHPQKHNRKWAYYGQHRLINYLKPEPPKPEPVPVPKPEPVPTPQPAPKPEPVPALKVGDRVKVVGVKYATGKTIPAWVKKSVHQIAQIKGDRALLVDRVVNGRTVNKGIFSWVYIKDLVKAS